MNERDAKREAAFRQHHACRQCGAIGLEERDGAEIDAMPGIKYRYCNACGHAQPVTKRVKRERLSA